MSTALVTGGLGFVGSYIAKDLIDNKIVDKVICLDSFVNYVNVTDKNFLDYRKTRLEDFSNEIIVERGDAKFYGVISNLIEKYRPKYIFHLASLPLAKIDNLNVEEAFESSVTATSNIIQICSSIKGYKPERFIYTSSSMVYGNFQENEVTEESKCNPIEIYGSAKLSGEIATKGLCNYFKIPWTIVRPSAVFGPTDMNNRISQLIIDKALQKETINIYGKDEKLDFTYVKNLSLGFVSVATHKNGINQIFNITNGKAHTLVQFLEEVKRYIPDVNYVIKERDESRPIRGTLSNEKIHNLINFKPPFTFEEGVREYVNYKLNESKK
tara:strand:+ start:51 stop:1028 length:978 start_codon:yes stop_codon:yes gene_type:complete